MVIPSPDVLRLLERWTEGDRSALDELIPLVYDRLRAVAHQRLRLAGRECSLNTTGLVHEAYLRLAGTSRPSVHSREHFLALASRVMRNLLVDHARRRRAAKRNGTRIDPDMDPFVWIPWIDIDAVTDLDGALHRLDALNERQSRILELRYFGGLTLEDTATALAVSLATVKRELRSALAWLASELNGEPVIDR